MGGGGGGGDGNSKGVGKNSVMAPYDYIVRAYLANIKNEIELGAKCTTGQGEIAEWRNSRNGIILITGLHIAIITSYIRIIFKLLQESWWQLEISPWIKHGPYS